jgi:hypothetical protein
VKDRALIRTLARALVPEDVSDDEAARAVELQRQLLAGLIGGWRYQALTLKLGDGIRYTPDFVVEEKDGTLTLEEVKGRARPKRADGSHLKSRPHYHDDGARVKPRVAPEIVPWFRVRVVWRLHATEGGGWGQEVY